MSNGETSPIWHMPGEVFRDGDGKLKVEVLIVHNGSGDDLTASSTDTTLEPPFLRESAELFAAYPHDAVIIVPVREDSTQG